MSCDSLLSAVNLEIMAITVEALSMLMIYILNPKAKILQNV